MQSTIDARGTDRHFDCAVIIPAASCLCGQIEAIRPQLTDRDCVVVVWNGPRPASHSCSARALSDSAAVWIEFPIRLGAAAARNAGVEWLGGRARILAFVDADDAAHHDWLKALRDHLSCGESDVVGGVLELVTRDGTRLVEPGFDFWYGQAVYGSNCAVTREGWKRLGGFRSGVGTCEDTDLAWRAGELGMRVDIVPAAVVRYSLRQGWAEWRQRVTWGRSSTALLRAHNLPLSRHLPSLRGLLRHKRSHGLATSPTIAGLGQFAGQWIGRLFDAPPGKSAVR